MSENEQNVETQDEPQDGSEPEVATPEAEQAPEEELSPKKRAKKLRKLSDEELIALEDEAAKAAHWLDVARRTQAELDNTLKRLKREHADDLKYANAPLVRDLLPILDNLGRALKAGEKKEDFKGLFDGVSLTNKMFVEVLSNHKVTPIEAEGEQFDPAVHEAMLTTSNPELEDDVVAAELERGWKLLDRVLRASKVQVNKKD